jgi:hypothetical protein
MANKIEFTDINPQKFVTATSRYANSRVVFYSEDRITTFETYKKSRFIPSQQDQVAVIPPGMQYRPDLVSRDRYGTIDFWWKIMEINGIKDIFDFKAGLTIVLPGNIYA